MPGRTIGQHIASRLVELGLDVFYTVPGDFNLGLLDELLKEPKLKMINTCNELNAGYAADGCARVKGLGCVCVTFTVGGLSMINALAGSFSEDLPIICITGGPNSNDWGTNRVLHHTIGITDFQQEARCFQQVTCAQAVVTNLDDARLQVDEAISTAMHKRQPCHIQIACNLASIPHPTFEGEPVPYAMNPKLTNQESLRAAVDAAAEVLNSAVRPVLLGGVKMRPAGAFKQLLTLADACQYPVALMPNAKGMFPEEHERFLGTYWGVVSSPYCCETVESADIYVVVGGIFNDYSSAGYSMLLKRSKMIEVQQTHVMIQGKSVFSCVRMDDFLVALSEKLNPNPTAFTNWQRMFVPPGQVPAAPHGAKLLTNQIFKHVQGALSSETAVLAETGDSWFNCQKLRLPRGCGFEFQMQYGSIGWSVGALLGYQQALAGKQRVFAFIGDGSFQVTAQDVSSMMRFGVKPIIFLINNKGYTIEVEIHDGPYNNINNWDYVKFVEALDNGQWKSFTARVETEEEFVDALEQAQQHTEGLAFIECIIHRDDCSKELLEWGSRVQEANTRPPNPQ